MAITRHAYDANGAVTGKTTFSATSGPQATPYAASYDAADRMVMVTLTLKGTGAGGADETFSLAYDENGNLSERRT